MSDLYGDLHEFSWRGISAPYRSFQTDGSADVAEHKRVDRDGARLENTGRNPYPFKVEILFINGLARGPNETWSDGLFPGTLSKFIAACEDRSSGELQHPIFGAINAKALTWPFDINADERGGVIVHATFKESTEDAAAKGLGAASLFSNVLVAAGNLDAAYPTLTPPPPSPDDASWSDFMNSLQSLALSVTDFVSSVTSKIDKAIAIVDDIAITFSSKPAVVESAVRIGYGLRQIKQQVFAQAKPTKFLQTTKAATVAGLAQLLNSDVSDLIKLNPGLVGSLVVPAQTIVRYFA